jgi:hypothetical protein
VHGLALSRGLDKGEIALLDFCVVKISKRTVAREWLIFLATFAVGGPLIFFVAYNSAEWRGDAWFAAILLCFPLYLSVMLIRSIWWSIKLVNISKRARYGTAVSIAVLVAAAVGAIAIKNTVDRRPSAVEFLESTPERTPELPLPVGAADLRKIILFDVTYDNGSGYGYGGEVRGRLRNELSRKIGPLKLTLSFFNSSGELIETKLVTINEVFYPGGPTSFHAYNLRSLNLPGGWTWKVTVSDASYTKDEN